jgi:acyl phosphate:glycerol-3-phosphate acyltransferase
MITFIIIILFAYLLGSISPSIILSQLVKGVDIRTYGSGNAGMTNAMRLLGAKWGTVVALIDLAKGFCAAWVIPHILLDYSQPLIMDEILIRLIAGFAAVVGHIWTVFFRFKGGKGVLTMAGAALGVAPAPVGICFGIFLLVLLTTRYVSLSSILAIGIFPFMVYMHEWIFQIPASAYLKIFSFCLAALIIYTHRANIVRLWKGEERKINSKKHAQTVNSPEL